MVPSRSAGGRLLGLTRDGTPVSTSSRSVKGIDYEVFDAPAGEYVATYPHTPPPSGAVGGSPATDTPAAPAKSNSGATPRIVRVSRRGVVKLAVRCPWSKRRCRITVRLKAARKTITRKTVMVKGPQDGEGEAAAAEGDAAEAGPARNPFDDRRDSRARGRSETDYPGAVGVAGTVRLADSGRRSGSA